MPFSVRLDDDTEALLIKTAKALDTTKSEILKASIQDFCKKTLKEKRKKPYDLLSDLIGQEFSGFFGSGKSHLLKMFRHLWVDSQFESDGATTRGLTQLPDEVSDLLKELDTLGKRCGGLHAASGTLPSGGGESVRLAVLSIILRSKGLPSSLPQAQFCIWLQKNNIYEKGIHFKFDFISNWLRFSFFFQCLKIHQR